MAKTEKLAGECYTLESNESCIRDAGPVPCRYLGYDQLCAGGYVLSGAPGVITMVVRRLLSSKCQQQGRKPDQTASNGWSNGISRLTQTCVTGFFKFSAIHWITLFVHCGGASPTINSVSNSIMNCFTPRVSLSRTTQCTVGSSGIGCSTCKPSTVDLVMPDHNIFELNSVILACEMPSTFFGAALGVKLLSSGSPSKNSEGNSGF